MGIQILEHGGDLLIQLRLVQERTVGISSNGKARRNAHARGGQGAVQLAEGGILAPNKWDVVQAEFGKPADIGYMGCGQWHTCSPPRPLDDVLALPRSNLRATCLRGLRGLVWPSRTPVVPGLWPVSLVTSVLVVREQQGDKLSRQGTACHHQEDPALTVVAGTTSTAHGASRSTRSATLPMKKRVTPGRPCVPMMMSCACFATAQLMISTAGWPVTMRRSGTRSVAWA